MNPAPFMRMTPKESETEQIMIRKEYKAKYLSEFYNIIIEKTKNNIIIRTTYYELKLNSQDLSLLTKAKFNSINEAFDFLINIFDQNRYYIKGIFSNKIILIISINDMIRATFKEFELELKENFEDKNYLIKELFNKYIKMEKDINEVKFNNKMLKDENNKLNKDNTDLKIEIESMKNYSNNSINGLQIQINNIVNMINQIKQQLSQFYNIVQQINQNQISSLNLNNQLSLNNFNENNNDINTNVIFRGNGYNWLNPFIVLCKPNDSINELIKKFREKIDYYKKDIKFIFNAKIICRNFSDTIENYGITNNSNIFVVKSKKINFIISNGYFYVNYIVNPNQKFSDIIKEFLSETGINASDINNYIYNLVNINPNQTLEEYNIKNDSDIIVELNKKSQIKYINIIFEGHYNKIAIKCLRAEKFSSVVRKFNEVTENQNNYIKFIFGSNRIDNNQISNSKWKDIEDKSVEDLGLKENSIIKCQEGFYKYSEIERDF